MGLLYSVYLPSMLPVSSSPEQVSNLLAAVPPICHAWSLLLLLLPACR
jgi:hypothetical protein